MATQFHAITITLLRLCLWLGTLVVIFVPLEHFFAANPRKLLRKGMDTDVIYFFVSSLIPAAVLSGPIALLAVGLHHAIPQRFLEFTGSWPIWIRAIAALLVSEVGYYWAHRMSHEIPFLWRFHSIHHSAEEIDFLVNTRAHPIDLVFSRFCALVPVYVLGFGGPKVPGGTMVPVLATLITTAWGFFIHANLRFRFGFLESIISTPAFHHWHHTLSGPINHNYSSTLPWLDRLFGTFHLPSQWPTAYGTEEKLPAAFTDQLFYPLQRPAPSPPPSAPAGR
jgi:sterol desaturase/sphingolipid hydroxylase (fatty acid hydroxylase superfamily)